MEPLLGSLSGTVWEDGGGEANEGGRAGTEGTCEGLQDGGGCCCVDELDERGGREVVGLGNGHLLHGFGFWRKDTTNTREAKCEGTTARQWGTVALCQDGREGHTVS